MSVSVSKEPVQHQFELEGITITAQAWGDSTGVPVLALHGWLDNSCSFSWLAPGLEGVQLVALDLAGQGWSGHRQPGQPYNLWMDVPEVIGVADQLGWERFSLLGHSRGAMISMLCAGTFPGRIERVACLDGFLPKPVKASDAPAQLAKSVGDLRKPRKKRVFETLEQMIELRCKVNNDISPEYLRPLVERSAQEVEGGFQWRYDTGLMAASAVKMTVEHLQGYIDSCAAELLLLQAEQGMCDPTHYNYLDGLQNLQVETLEGGHHFHMSESAAVIAERLATFFASK